MPAAIVEVHGGSRSKNVIPQSSTEGPLVTVITAVYNGESCIAACIESVLAQDYPNVEHIVVDGGSTDRTVEILRHYDDRIALWRSEADFGIYDAWNKALLDARGEWICFLGADDRLLPSAVSQYIALAAEHPEAEYLSSRIKVIHPSGYVRVLGSAWNWKTFSRRMCTPHVGSMHRRSLFDRLGAYDTSYRIVADYELLLRARDELKAAYMPRVTVIMEAGGLSTTGTALKEAARAKVSTGKRSRGLTAIELCIECALFLIRPPVRWLLKRMRVQLG